MIGPEGGACVSERWRPDRSLSMASFWRRLWPGVALALACVAPSHALQMVPLSLEELAGQADVVLHGKVRSKACQRDAAGRIYTLVELDVAAVWKGAVHSQPFPIVLAGGTLGSERSVAFGQAEYWPGEEVVAFLRINARGQGVTLGLAQGKFSAWRDQTTGEILVRNLFHGIDHPKDRPGSPSLPGRNRLTLQGLRRTVAAALQ